MPRKADGGVGISSYDVIGSIAIIEVPEGGDAKKIARAIVESHPNITTVMMKGSERTGEFRLRELKSVIGKETVTEHKESGCRFRLDVTKAYFSPREGTERERVAAQVRPGEKVLVMFAGIGPFAIVIGRKQPKVSKVYAIEINSEASKYMEENVRLNKLKYVVEPMQGDAGKAAEMKEIRGKCSRVIMPLPHEGRKYLESAILCLKPKGVVHFYYVGPEEDPYTFGKDIIRMECKKLGKKYRILSTRKVLPYGPRMFKVCIEFEVD